MAQRTEATRTIAKAGEVVRAVSTAAVVMRTAANVLHREAPTPASTTKPRATQPRMGRRAMYRMLSQWINPERNVIALPAE